MRMAKNFAMRVPLEVSQGNTGTIITTGDEAHMRYTQLKMSEITKYLYGGLEKNAIKDWKLSFNEKDTYPTVMPSIGFYNIVNGTIGLGVAISANIPQFNLKETNENIIKLIKNPELPAEEVINMPDFATGGYLLNADEVKQSLINGTGKACRLRAKVKYDADEHALVVTEVPYSVYTSTLTNEIKQLVENNENYGVDKINDMSGKTANYIIYLSKNASPTKMLKKLYKDTSLESHFTINMWALDQGRFPKIFGLKDFYLTYINHIRECKRNEIEFDLNKAEERMNIVNGLLKALLNIDDIINLIKKSASPIEASQQLIEIYDFNEAQVKAILAMKLSSLTKLDRNKLENEHEELTELINKCNYLLSNEKALDEELIKILKEVADKFGDDRRTVIMNTLGDEEEDNTLDEKMMIIYISKSGAIITKETVDLQIQNKKTLGTKIKFRDKEDTIWKTIVSKNTDKLMAFSNKGRAYVLSVDDIPVDQEDYLSALLNLNNEEYITEILPVVDNAKYLVFATKQGMFKKGNYKDYSSASRKCGVSAINLKDGDEIVSVKTATDDDKILFATKLGRVVIFENRLVNAIGRTGAGVKGIGLDNGDEVISMQIVNDSTTEILSITTDGHCKRNSIKDYTINGRGTKGIKNFSFKGEDNFAAGVLSINDQVKEIIISSGKSNLKMELKSIPVLTSKTAQGVMTLNTKLGKINNVVAIENL